MISGMSLSGASVEVGPVKGTDAGGHIRMRVTLYSDFVPMVGVAFQYRLDFLDSWHDDAAIRSADYGILQGNEIHDLVCSPQGTETTFVWDHDANGITSGMRCQVRALVIPSVSVLCRSGRVTTVESVSKGYARLVGRMVEGIALCTDDEGGLVIGDNHSVSRMPRDGGARVVLASGLNHPKCAASTGRGSVVILDEDGALREVTNEGVLVAVADVSALASGETGLSCDPQTGNILLAGGSIPKVHELSWSQPNYGEVMWAHGAAIPGGGLGYLYLPRHASYGSGIDLVLICDWGNNRVVMIDRSKSPQEESSVSDVTIDSTVLPLRRPIRCSMVGGAVLVCEEDGEIELFSSDPALHPSMVRSDVATATGKDALPQYSGLKFVPIIRSVK